MRHSFELRVRVRRRQRDRISEQQAVLGFAEGEEWGSDVESSGGRRPYNLFARLPRSVAVELRASSSTSTAEEENVTTSTTAMHAESSAVFRESGGASSSWIDSWFRHGRDRCDATEEVEFLPLRIEFRERDGSPVVVYGSYNGGELAAATVGVGGGAAAAGTWEEDRMCELVCSRLY